MYSYVCVIQKASGQAAEVQEVPETANEEKEASVHEEVEISCYFDEEEEEM